MSTGSTRGVDTHGRRKAEECITWCNQQFTRRWRCHHGLPGRETSRGKGTEMWKDTGMFLGGQTKPWGRETKMKPRNIYEKWVMKALVCWLYSALRGRQNTRRAFSLTRDWTRSCNRKHDQYISPLAVGEVYEGGEEGREESFSVEDSMKGLQEEGGLWTTF